MIFGSDAGYPRPTELDHRIDVIGDIHGQLRALNALGRHLGYDTEHGWAHPEGRVPVFVGDLIDRGAHSFEVGKLVMELVRGERAVCLMGNHEYNIVRWDLAEVKNA